LQLSIAAKHGCDLYSTDTEDEEVYVKPETPDWWFDPIPRATYLSSRKQSMAPSRRPGDGIRRFRHGLRRIIKGYPAVNSEKTVFMKRTGHDFIVNGLYVEAIKT
jgi:hypothetical protein